MRVKPKVWTELVKSKDETAPESTATAANVVIDKTFFEKKKKDGSTTPTESLTVKIDLRKESRRLGEMTHAFVSPGDFKYKKTDTDRDYNAFVEYSCLSNQKSELVPLEKCVLPESVGKELKQMYDAIKSEYVLSSWFVNVQLARLGYKFDFKYSYYFFDEIQSSKIYNNLFKDSKNEREKKLYLNKIYEKGDEKWIVQYYKEVNESVDSTIADDVEDGHENDKSEASGDERSVATDIVQDESDNSESEASGEGNIVENDVYLVSTYFGKGYFRFPAETYPSPNRTYSVKVDAQVATVTKKNEEATDKKNISLLIRIKRNRYEYVGDIGDGIKIPSENQVFLKNGPKPMERVYNTFFEAGRPQREAKSRGTTKDRFTEKIGAHFATFFRNGIDIIPDGYQRSQARTEKIVIFVCLYYYARHNREKCVPFFHAVCRMFVKGGHPIADTEEKKFIGEIRSIR